MSSCYASVLILSLNEFHFRGSSCNKPSKGGSGVRSAFLLLVARRWQKFVTGTSLQGGGLRRSCMRVWRHLGYVQFPAFHLRHGSPDGLGGGRGAVFSVVSHLLVIAKTADSMALRRSRISGSGLPRWAHSRSVWLVAKHSSHHLVPEAMPVKHMVYRVELIADHRVLLVRAAWRRNAASYRTQARPE